MTERLGFIGIGTMGTPMSRRLLAAGYPLVVYDVRPGAVAPLAELGAEVASDPADLAERCGKVITMLPNSLVVEEVVLGERGLVHGLKRGSVLIDMSSPAPDSTKRLAATLAARGIEMLDAFALDTKAVRQILVRNYRPGFTTDLLYKDLEIATTLGRRSGVPMLAANLALQILSVARGRGMGALDNSAVVKLLEEAAGVTVMPQEA